MSDFQVEFYALPDGEKPVKTFIESLEIKMKAKVLRSINLLQNNGYNLREPYSKSLKNGILELRIQVSTNITRILYFFYHERKIVLTNGFAKKTQQTPSNELEKAIKYRNDYIARKDI